MIYCLTGKILKKTLDTVVISCAGVGYAAQVPTTTAEALPAAGHEATLYTVLSVSENDIALYGFASEDQRACFKLLTSVSGVGPKAGLAILSILTPEKVALAASSGDHKAFTAASGVGPKLAQRIVLEMKDKVGALPLPGGGAEGVPMGTVSLAAGAEEAVRALTMLGFSASEASAAVGKLDSALPVEELVRGALKSLARRG